MIVVALIAVALIVGYLFHRGGWFSYPEYRAFTPSDTAGEARQWVELHEVRYPLTYAAWVGGATVLAAGFGAEWPSAVEVAMLVLPWSLGVSGIVLLLISRALSWRMWN